MSKEYIERDAAVAFLENMAASRYLIQCFENKEQFPTADVAPVVHGEWSIVWVDRGHIDMEKMYKCSVCGGRKYNDYRYCPECGAYMDGGNSNVD